MKKLNVCLFVVGFCMLAGPLALMAQSTGDPPPCCPRSPEILGENQSNPVSVQGQFLVSLGMLESQGITRKQFIDRLSASFFPGKLVDVVLAAKALVSQPGSGDRTVRPGRLNVNAGRHELITVEQTVFYRMRIDAVSAEELEGFDLVGLTDGEYHLTVRFSKRSSL